MNCSVCARPLFPGRAVFRCQCSVVSHAYCWEKHVAQSHRPLFAVGYVTMDDEFKPTGAAVEGRKQPVEKGVVAGEKEGENFKGKEIAPQSVSDVAGLAAEQKEQD